MGHVSNFNGMNTCDVSDLNHVSSDLISTDNILDSHLNENLLPISNAFSDDIYPDSNLYGSSLISVDNEKNGYFEGDMFDFLFDSEHSFIDFDVPDPILQNEEPDLGNDINVTSDIAYENSPSAEVNRNSEKQDEWQESVKSRKCSNECQESADSHINEIQNNLKSESNEENKTYTAETVFMPPDSSVKKDKLPKIILRLKHESSSAVYNSSSNEASIPLVTEASVPLTIADNVKLGRRRTSKVSDSESYSSICLEKSHKRKSHKKEKSVTKDICKSNYDSNIFYFQNCYLTEISKTQPQILKQNISKCDSENLLRLTEEDSASCQIPNKSFNFKHQSPVDVNFHTYISNHQNNSFFITDSAEIIDKKTAETEHKQSVIDNTDSFEFDFKNANILPMSSDFDKEKELNSVDDILEQLDIPLINENIPDMHSSLLIDIETVNHPKSPIENSTSDKDEISCPVDANNLDATANNSFKKDTSASALIDELHAHNQQVFEEIEISTPELELKLSDSKSPIEINNLETSHQTYICANGNASMQCLNKYEHGENDMNSQNHLPVNKNSSIRNKNVSTCNATTTHNGTVRPRNTSPSSSVNSKSSSHRSYRKRSRSRSTSSSSDDEKWYTRKARYDHITKTYCDEFGRTIRPKDLKYLDSKFSHSDSHSNNGSSSSIHSRSKSPRHRSHHRKHYKSRSNSKNYRKRYYSSSRSRSRSRDRRHKYGGKRRYRSPSPKHRKRPHYMDLEENIKANEDRRVMYVGDIPPGYTVEQLKERFGQFGPIQDATIKSKTTSDSSLYIFGFVTFKNRLDACNAIENGNNHLWPKFDLNFGGRRRFCNGNYTDLDGKVAEAESGWYNPQAYYHKQVVKKDDDFAELLRLEQKRLGMAKK